MDVKPGYKQTEVGVIPQSWDVKRLREISPKQSVGLVINPSTYFDPSGSVPMLVGSNVGENRIDWEGSRKISAESNEKLPASKLYVGDLVTVRVGDPGVTAVIPPEHDSSNCASMMIVRAHESFDSHWLCYLMNSRFGRSRIESVQYGTAQKQFNISDAVDFVYPFPPLREQRLISTVLSDVDAMIAGLEKLIAKKRNIKQAAMQQLLTGETRLPGFGGNWRTASLESITTRSTGFWGAKLQDDRNTKRAEIIRAGDISQDGRLVATATRFLAPDEFSRASCQLDDLVITTSGNGLGKLWCSDGRKDVAASNFVRVLRPVKDRSVGRFLFYALRTVEGVRQLQEHTATSAYPNLRPTYFSTAWIPLPSVLEQATIAQVLSDMDAEIDVLSARQNKAVTIKEGMMQELLTGRTRLV